MTRLTEPRAIVHDQSPSRTEPSARNDADEDPSPRIPDIDVAEMLKIQAFRQSLKGYEQ